MKLFHIIFKLFQKKMASIPTEGPTSDGVCFPISDEDLLDLLLRKSIAQNKLKREVEVMNYKPFPENRVQQLDIMNSRIKKLCNEVRKAKVKYLKARYNPTARGRQDGREEYEEKEKELDENKSLLKTLKYNWKNNPCKMRSHGW